MVIDIDEIINSIKKPSQLRAPYHYYGGKMKHAPYIVALIPRHKRYVEAFGGDCHIFWAKPPSPEEIINDIDDRIVNFYHVLRDEKKFFKLWFKIMFTPYSRKDHYLAEKIFDGEIEADEIDKAWAFYVMVMTGFAGHVLGGFNPAYKDCKTFDRRKLSFFYFHFRISNVIIENCDALKLIPRYDDPETFFYCGPPYPIDSLKLSKPYPYMMTYEQHEKLLEILNGIKGMCIISSYPNKLYDKMLFKRGWGRFYLKKALESKKVKKGEKRSRMVEAFYINPKALKRLKEEGPMWPSPLFKKMFRRIKVYA